MFIPPTIDIPEEPKAAVDIVMPLAPIPATPAVPIFAMPTVLVFAIPTAHVSITAAAPTSTGPSMFFFLPSPSLSLSWIRFLHLIHSLCHIPCLLLGLILTVVATPSQFEVGSSFATVLDPANEAVVFFTCLEQPEVNDLDPAYF